MAMDQYDIGLNPLHEIVMVSLVLGLIMGSSATLIVASLLTTYNQLLVYFIILSIFYFNEFHLTSKYQTSKTTSKSFLIYGNQGNKEFILVQIFTVWEYLFKRSRLYHQSLRLQYCRNYYVIALGGILIISGFVIRYLAMKTCGDSFSHIIITNKKQNSKLVTNGIYRWFRHPSYLGFWLLTIGIQLFLENYFGLVSNVTILSYFFKVRIEFEEWFLIHRQYGEDYIKYKQRVGTWIPFVKIKKNI